MGEAIITSRSAAQEEAVPVVPGYHSILATVRDYQGKLLKDYPINCKDGETWYNYKTNETGKVLFTCNSGAANISINNVIDGYRYLDFPNHIMNCDCPIGGQTRLAFNIPKTTTTNFSFGAGTSLVRFLHDQECSGYIVGGGGGGSSAANGPRNQNNGNGASGGGGGYLTEFNNLNFASNFNYNIYVGSGGIGGQPRILTSTDTQNRKSYYYTTAEPGNSGGSSTISNMNISANGGGGGQNGFLVRARTAGFGYGGMACENGGSSGSAIAGGGGAGESGLCNYRDGSVSWGGNSNYIGGAPYGGNSGNAVYQNAYTGSWYDWIYTSTTKREDGKGPGGGGGAGSEPHNSRWSSYAEYVWGGNGAAGICKLNMVNY